MAVRFLPLPETRAESRAEAHAAIGGRDRGDLAEVIELRSRLPVQREQERVRSQDYRRDQDQSQRPETVEIAEIAATTETAETAETADNAAADAVRLLARRARSSGELRSELSALGHDAVTVEAVMLECETNLYIDDSGLARVLAENLRQRRRASRSQIRIKLRERLLPDGVIEETLQELDDDEEHELLQQAAHDRARKLVGLDRQTAERRLLGFLARRGWSGERAMRVAREALDGAAARGTVRFR